MEGSGKLVTVKRYYHDEKNIRRNAESVEAVFHGFFNTSDHNYDPPTPQVVAVVELADGTVEQVNTWDITFVRPALAKWRKVGK